jgi:prepilin-type N-terminal cleavage/methylation domain-containing protein
MKLTRHAERRSVTGLKYPTFSPRAARVNLRLSKAGCKPALRGFSLIEVMVAIVILAVAVVGLTQGFTTALASSKDSELQTTAALFAAGQIESLRAAGGLADETTEGDCGDDLPRYRWRQTISPAGTDGLHEVDVVVENSQTGAMLYELKTLLFEVPADSTDKSKKSKAGAGGGAAS